MATMEKLKSGKNFIIYGDGDRKLIKIEDIRFSYPHFGHVKENEDDNGNVKKSWGGVAMLPKKTHVEAKEAFIGLLNELQDANKVKVPPEYRCIKNGDDKDDEVMHGHWLITFNEAGRHRPPARTVRAEVISDPDEIDEVFFGGCWGSVLLRPWFFNGKAKNSTKTYPKRLICGYNGVQFLRKDKPFGTGVIDDTDMWGSVDSGGSDDGDDTSDDGL